MFKRKCNKKKRDFISNQEYRFTYLQRRRITDRRHVCVSKELHQRLSAIVRYVGDNDSTLSSYIENIIAEHLEQHKGQINSLYKDNLSVCF